jgi:hypothetical protein
MKVISYMKEINPKHKAFADEYLVNGFIGCNAYSKIYDKDLETHYNYCKSAASVILARPEVASYLKDRLEDNHLSVDEALTVLRFLAIQKGELATSLGAVKLILQINEKLTDKIEVKTTEYKAVWG